MTVGELGVRMSNYELNVTWPAYFAHKARVARAQAEKSSAGQRGFA